MDKTIWSFLRKYIHVFYVNPARGTFSKFVLKNSMISK